MKPMQRYKSLVLPVALVVGYLLRSLCATLSPVVPVLIFAILLLTFSGVDLKRLRPTRLDLLTALFQTFISIGIYAALLSLTGNDTLAQGGMMCVLCPVASSVTVVASMLGANPRRTTTYTIAGNLLVALIAPLYITLIRSGQDVSFAASFRLIMLKIMSIIALPFFIAFIMQRFTPKINAAIARFKSASFYLWALALLLTIGQTADFVAKRWQSNLSDVLWLGVISLFICILQFAIGKMLGRHYGDAIAGGQQLAQKNSAMGIWILNSFLNPVASVGMAFYSIWQNLYNSWQLACIHRNS